MVKLKNRTELQKNIRIVCFFFIILFSIITFRAYFLGVLKSGELCKRIQKQNKSKIILYPNRGTIHDRNGIELAVSLKVKSLFARPHLIEDRRNSAKKIASVLGISQTTILKQLNSKKNFVWIQRKVSPLQAEKIESFNISGLGFLKETKRFYPNRELAGQLIGFTGMDSKGLEGIELEYDSVLKGRSQELIVVRDAHGKHLFTEGYKISGQTHGNDITLTIDKNIQYIAEKELQAAVSMSGAKQGITVIMDPWTGEVLALAMVPLFNPNQFRTSKAKTWKNRAVTDMFEPGSTFKPFLIASALEEGLIKSKDIFFCENGVYRISGRTIHDSHPYGWLNVRNILKHSSNIGVSKISRQLGMELFYQYIRKFGFGNETGVQFPTEAQGYVPLPYKCSKHTQSTIAFGQGLSVTALQLATSYCAIANGGLLMQPCLVSKITNQRGMTVQKNQPSVRHRVISENKMLMVREMLKSVIEKDGTGRMATVAGFTVAGKTGTSQKTESGKIGYLKKKTIASFAGFVPADNPKLVILVIIDEPEKFTYGGEIAAPAFSKMAYLIMNYLGISPDLPFQQTDKQWKETKTSLSKIEKLG